MKYVLKHVPDFWWETDDRVEHAIDVEITKDTFHLEAIDRERNLWDRKI